MDREDELLKACEIGDGDKVFSLLGDYPNIVDCANKHGMTPLIVAASKGYKDVVIKLLAGGASIDRKDILGCTALIRASSKGHHEVVDFLLAIGADGSIQDYLKRTYIDVKDKYVKPSRDGFYVKG